MAALVGIAVLSRYVRAQMLEVLGQDYVRTARAKGLDEDQVVYAHALRNALLPFVTMFGLLLPGLISGSVIFEQIFAWPGLGLLGMKAQLQISRLVHRHIVRHDQDAGLEEKQVSRKPAQADSCGIGGCGLAGAAIHRRSGFSAQHSR